jgi:hypothetical protein
VKHRSGRVLAIVAALSVMAGAAFASGSEGVGSVETGDAHAYNVGKSVYATKLACDGCALHGKTLTVEVAKELLAGKGLPQVSDEEAQALGVYLKRRFKL